MKKIFFLGFIFALFTVTASAQKRNDIIQRHRIQRGFENHQLTRGEKFRLQRNHAISRHERRRALRDGKVTPMEKRKMHQMRMHNSHQTYRLKHNFRRRVI